MAKKIRSKKISKKKVNSKSKVLIFLVIFFSLASLLFLFLTRSNNYLKESVFTYDECVKLGGKINNNAYPKLCRIDEKDYIEILEKDIDSSDWNTISSLTGLTVKCPPSWICSNVNNRQISFTSNPNIGIFQIELITSENFQESSLRHPKYTNPQSWLKALVSKDPLAIKVLPETARFYDNSPYPSQPSYANFDYSEMERVNYENIEGVRFVGNGIVKATILFLKNNNIAYITSGVNRNSTPIVNTIISTIK